MEGADFTLPSANYNPPVFLIARGKKWENLRVKNMSALRITLRQGFNWAWKRVSIPLNNS
jgi:hypothetical protein